jgi:hypothetical protein
LQERKHSDAHTTSACHWIERQGIAHFLVHSEQLLSTKLTTQLLASIQLKTGHPRVDAVIESVVHLCLPEVESVLQKRDAKLASFTGANKLQNLRLELLSELPIDLDEKLKRLM